MNGMSSRKNFIWGFVIFAALMVLGGIFAIWLVFRLAGTL
jgi:hypothetical protein